MDHKIKFLDDFSMDRKLYWRVGDVYGRYDWEIMYEKDRPDGAWRVRRSGGDVWFSIDGKNLFSELSARQVDVLDFDRQLCSNILTQAIFSSSLFEEAKKILGEQTISEAIIQHNQFAEELLKMIKDLTGTNGHNHSPDHESSVIKSNDQGIQAQDASRDFQKDSSDSNQLFVSTVQSNPKDQTAQDSMKKSFSPSDMRGEKKENCLSVKNLSGHSSKSQKEGSKHSGKGHDSKMSQEGKKPWLRLVKD